MKTEILSQEKNVIEAKAEFTPEELDAAVERTYKQLATHANLHGFRKGRKIPRRALELYFPKESVCAETESSLVEEAVDKMIEEFELKLIERPDVKPGEFKMGETFTVTAKFEATPEVELPDLGSIEVEKPNYEVTDEMVEENIRRILDNHSELEPTYEDRPIVKEDFASVKYDSVAVHEDGSEKKLIEGQKTEFALGSDTLRPEMAEAVIGKKPGDKVTVEFPAEGEEAKKDHVVKARYDVEILGIMKKKTPELTDDFVASISRSKVKTVDEFKASIRRQLETVSQNRAKEDLIDAMLDKVTEQTEIEIPQKLIDRQKNAVRARQEASLKRDNMTMEQLLEKEGLTKEKYEEELDESSKAAVKRALVLGEIADENDIMWTREEMNTEIATMAAMSGVDIKKLREYLSTDDARLYEIGERIRERKTREFLLTAVKTKDAPKAEAKEEAKAEEKKD